MSLSPFPWAVRDTSNGGLAVVDADGNPIVLCSLYMEFGSLTRAQAAANATFIAAAPATHAALVELQANPNDPRAHRTALDAMALTQGFSTGDDAPGPP